MSLRTAALILASGAFGAGTPLAVPVTAQNAAFDPATPPAEVLQERGSQLRVWLVTAGPGDAVWERYGHNAIRVLDTSSGRDVSYNWGIFDFQRTDFIPRFLQGRMLYMMAPFQTRAMVESYERANREVILQELDLTASQKAHLESLAATNVLPENRDYTYQYFLDNCSTRVRDLLNQVLKGALETQFITEPTGMSYRDHTRRLTQIDPFIYTGMDLLLGSPTDQKISIWEEMFLPMTLRDQIRNVTVTGPDGTLRPLVSSEQIVVGSSRPSDQASPPSWFAIYVLLGLVLAGVLASSSTQLVRSTPLLRFGVVAFGTLWTTVGGIAGTILVLLLFTDHTFAYWNENLFLFNPLLIGLAALLPFSGRAGRSRKRARALSLTIAGIALLGLLWQVVPLSTHANAMFFALALPAHLTLAFGLTRDPA